MAQLSKRFLSPLRILFIIIVAIFLAEVVAMIVVYYLKPKPYYLETLIDAVIMTGLIFPVLYFLSFRPLLSNIEQLKQAEKALWESNEFLERMFSVTHVLIAYMDPEFNFIQVNRAYAAADERDPDFYIGKNHFDLFPNEENETIFRNVVATGQHHFTYAKPFEYAEHPERGVSYWDWSLIPIKAEDGKVTGVVLSLIDVTPRKKAELALLESERRFQAIFNQTFQFIALIAPDGTLIEINQTALDFAGKKRSALVGKPIWEALAGNIPPQTKRKLGQIIQEAAQGNFIRFEGEITGTASTAIAVDFSLKPITNDEDKVSLIIAEGRDITERKRMQKALELEQQRLYSLLDQLPAFVALQSSDYSIRFANNQFRQRFGDPDGKLCYQIMHGYDEPCSDCRIPQVIKDRSPQMWEKTYQDGKSFQIYGYPFSDVDHSPQVLELGVDISENKQAQAKIQQNAARAILLAETLKSIMEVGPDYQAVLDMIARSTAELIGDGCVIRLISADRSTHSPAAFHHSDPQSLNLLSQVLVSDVQPVEAGVTGHVIQTGRPFHLPSLEADHNDVDISFAYHNYFERRNLHSMISVPLHAGDELIGTLALFRDQTNQPYNQDDMEFAQSLADQAALAIQNARLYQAELAARQSADILRDASLALTQTLDLTTVLDKFLEYANRLVAFDHARIFLIEDETHLSLQAQRGSSSLEASTVMKYDSEGEPFIHALLSKKKTILIPDIPPETKWIDQQFDGKNAKSWLGIPLIAEERAIGLCAFEKTNPMFFTEHHVQLLEALVGQVTVIIQNAWLFEQVRSGRERLQSLSRRLVEVQESERHYIARELHDEASQALASLMVGLRLIERHSEQPDSVLAGAADLKLITEGVIENLHRLAMDLRPASLDHLGLVAALRQHAEAISDRHNLVVQFDAIGIENRLPSDTETAIYRIVQEALSNVILHAQATRVDVLLEKRSDKLITIVEDNGAGFDSFRVALSGRLGLVGMRERADMLGGSLTVESQPGSGTTLLIEVPYGD